MTREKLDNCWHDDVVTPLATELGGGYLFFKERIDRLIAAERAYADRAAMARAVRFAAHSYPDDLHWPFSRLSRLADAIERGDMEVPDGR